MTGDFLTAEDAYRIGLYNRVVRARGACGGGARARRGARARSLVRARDHQGRARTARRTWTWQPRSRPRRRSRRALMLHPGLPRGLRGVPRQAAREVRVSGDLPDDRRSAAGAAFLDDEHVELRRRHHALVACAPARAGGAARLTRRRAAKRARCSASLDAAGWLSAIGRQDLRALCLVREAVAAASPLADAVVALQALGGTPLVLAGTGEQRARWLPADPRGPHDGRLRDDRAGRRLRRRGDADHGAPRRRPAGSSTARSISSPTPASPTSTSSSRVTSPGQGSRGISAFLVPADAPGFASPDAQVLAAPHPLGRLRFESLPRAWRRAPRRGRTAGSSSA